MTVTRYDTVENIKKGLREQALEIISKYLGKIKVANGVINSIIYIMIVSITISLITLAMLGGKFGRIAGLMGSEDGAFGTDDLMTSIAFYTTILLLVLIVIKACLVDKWIKRLQNAEKELKDGSTVRNAYYGYTYVGMVPFMLNLTEEMWRLRGIEKELDKSILIESMNISGIEIFGDTLKDVMVWEDGCVEPSDGRIIKCVIKGKMDKAETEIELELKKVYLGNHANELMFTKNGFEYYT